MSKVANVRVVILASLFLIPLHSIAADENDTHYYQLEILADAEINADGKPQRIRTDSSMSYSWSVKGNRRVLQVQSIETEVQKGEEPANGGRQSRAGISIFENGERRQVPIEGAPKGLQEFLKASFDVPLCEISVDDQKREVGRQILASSNAQQLLVDGTIQNAVLFHAPIEVSKNFWSAPCIVNAGQGRLIPGTLNYKWSLRNGNLRTYTGTCVKDVIDDPNAPIIIRDTVYSVSGKQTYDVELGEWVSGRLKMGSSRNFVAVL